MPMRRPFTSSLLVLALAACGAPDRSGSRSEAPADSTAAPAPAAESRSATGGGPDIGVTAAPGVAFNYRYAFRLRPERIEQVQEEHAQMCERLGPQRCRITGMRYRLVSPDDIDASLEFGLEPSLARRFGREGLAAVLRAEGMLVESAISGTDVGTGISRDARTIEQLRQELARIEQQIATAPDDRKGALEEEARALRDRIRVVEQNRDDAQATLATTPMTFVYGSGAFEPGFGQRPSFGRVAADAWERFLDGAAVLFLILVTLLPWALLAGLVGLAVRAVRRRWPRRAAEAAPVERPPASEH
jgi:hypothetical protein